MAWPLIISAKFFFALAGPLLAQTIFFLFAEPIPLLTEPKMAAAGPAKRACPHH